MARLDINGIAGLCADLESLGADADSLVEDILEAQAEVIVDAQKKSARSMGVYDTGQTYDSIRSGKTYKDKDGASKYVYPGGSRTRGGKKTRNAEIAFLNEFGKREQPPRPFIRTANEQAAEKAVEVAEREHDNFLRQKNL